MLETVRLWGKRHLERAREADASGPALNCLASW